MYNLDLRWVMSFHLIPHLPRLVAWERGTAVANGRDDGHYENLYRYRLAKGAIFLADKAAVCLLQCLLLVWFLKYFVY